MVNPRPRTGPSGGAATPSEPSQPSLRRMREFDVRPRRDLGQNFLIDSNILGVIARAAELDDADVVLEIGGGLGVLSEYLAPRAAHVHVVELDRALEPALRDAIGPFDNVTLHLQDAMRLDLGALTPAPTKVVANLPYGIAAGAILRTIEDLEGVERWVGMVQKEVGARFAAPPGSAAYGVPSVLAQLACDVRVLRSVARTVFSPVPNVDSVLVGLQRTGPAAQPTLRELVSAAFAHRRKALARSLALAPGAEPDVRERAREALARLGHPVDVRAERLSPQDFRALHETLRT
ncbi:MAG: rRNA (adenine1518-N6/adenine1519-N6)-dimethyltransferase [Solirubrobacteraceae bacterium]|nr:rRNA (adenine1518-N6/adenine1519-N6)-dimethyltransferase [Solirubrobacteraceae bacterium]